MFKDTICIKADSSYSEAYPEKRDKIILCKPLCEVIVEMMVTYFFRTHKSWYLNFDHVVRILPPDPTYKGRFVELSNGMIAKCTHEIYPYFRDALEEYRMRNILLNQQPVPVKKEILPLKKYFNI